MSSKIDNPVILATQDKDKQNKNTTQSSDNGNIGYTRQRQTKQKHNTIQW